MTQHGSRNGSVREASRRVQLRVDLLRRAPLFLLTSILIGLAACSEGPGTSSEPSFEGTWNVTSWRQTVDFVESELSSGRTITIISRDGAFSIKYDPPLLTGTSQQTGNYFQNTNDKTIRVNFHGGVTGTVTYHYSFLSHNKVQLGASYIFEDYLGAFHDVQDLIRAERR